MSYCIYLRKSRADKELEFKEDVLFRHERALLDLAKSRNYNITKIFKEVVSGETLAARPQMQELLTEVESGLWEGVLVMEVERLARGNTIDQGIVSQAFKYSNTLIITPNKVYNPANEFDEEYFEFGLFMSRREYKTINRRLIAGRLASCKEGKYVGSAPPYGYKKIKLQGQKGFTLVPDEKEAEIVKLIFKWYTQEDRIGTRKICYRLDEMGIKPHIADKWSLASIRDMLTNDVYIGKIHWNKSKTIKSTINGAVSISRPRQKEFDVYDGLHQPLIDLDTFEKAQYYMSLNPSNPGKGTVNPLSGLIICSACGKKMVRRPSKTVPDYLICPTPHCRNIGTQLSTVETKVVDGVRLWLNQYKINNNSISKTVLMPVNNDNLIRQLDKKIEQLNNQLNNTYSLLEQGLYSKELFLERQKTLKNELDLLNVKKNTLLDEDKKNTQKAELKNQLIPQAEKIDSIYYKLSSPKQKNDLLKSVFTKIIYTKEKGGRWDKSALDDFKLEFISKLD